MVANILRGWNVMPTYRKLIVGLLGVGLVLFGFWTLSPLFYNRHVDEAFPVAAPASHAVMATAAPAMAAQAAPTAMMADQAAMASDAAMANQAAPTAMMSDQAAMANQAAPTAMAADAAMAGQAVPTAMAADTAMANQAAPTAVMADKAEPAVPLALTAGMFISGSTPGHHVNGKATIYRLEGDQPLLRLEDFSATNGPDLFVVLSSSANPDQDGVKKSTYLQLEALKGNIGNQNYKLPGDVDLNQYKSVVIWCRTFNVVFGYAPLQSAS
jgi:hypothetical protein